MWWRRTSDPGVPWKCEHHRQLRLLLSRTFYFFGVPSVSSIFFFGARFFEWLFWWVTDELGVMVLHAPTIVAVRAESAPYMVVSECRLQEMKLHLKPMSFDDSFLDWVLLGLGVAKCMIYAQKSLVFESTFRMSLMGLWKLPESSDSRIFGEWQLILEQYSGNTSSIDLLQFSKIYINIMKYYLEFNWYES